MIGAPVLLSGAGRWRKIFSDRASVAVGAAFLLAASLAPAGEEPVSGKVVDVHDGDTVTVESDGVRHKCRLLGIDAPEMSHARLWVEMDRVVKYARAGVRAELDEAREAFRRAAERMEERAREARRALAGMVMEKAVLLAYDADGPRRDRYGRLLAYVSVDGTDVNAEMTRRGFAVAETRFPCDRLDEYVGLCRAARAAGVGLWSAGAGEKAAEQAVGE